MINAWNVTKIVTLVEVTNNLSTILGDADIIKVPCPVVVGELVANVLAVVDKFGKGRANRANATSMGLPCHCCFFVVVLHLIMSCIVQIPTVQKSCSYVFYCANFNNLVPTMAIEVATDVWLKHT